jgi:hypothetical protein
METLLSLSLSFSLSLSGMPLSLTTAVLVVTSAWSFCEYSEVSFPTNCLALSFSLSHPPPPARPPLDVASLALTLPGRAEARAYVLPCCSMCECVCVRMCA